MGYDPKDHDHIRSVTEKYELPDNRGVPAEALAEHQVLTDLAIGYANDLSASLEVMPNENYEVHVLNALRAFEVSHAVATLVMVSSNKFPYTSRRIAYEHLRRSARALDNQLSALRGKRGATSKMRDYHRDHVAPWAKAKQEWVQEAFQEVREPVWTVGEDA